MIPFSFGCHLMQSEEQGAHPSQCPHVVFHIPQWKLKTLGFETILFDHEPILYFQFTLLIFGEIVLR